MLRSTALAALLLLSAFAASARAGIRPSFYLEYCSWSATHVVVASEGEKIDGRLTVVESWKGDLHPGETVDVPELAAFSSKPTRLVKRPFGDEGAGPPVYVTGDRVLLFLKEKPGEAGAAAARAWEPASREGVKVSAVWIEGDKTYAFIQVMNPGESILVDYGKTEAEIRERFSEVNAEHESFERVVTAADPSVRAEALEPFTRSELYFAREAAFDALRRCGASALPVLRRVLRDPARLKVHGDVVTVMADIGGEGAGEELTAVVSEELRFWQATGPGLSKGWWNRINEPETETLRSRYTKLYLALLGLRKLGYAGSRAAVTELRDFWRSLPQLEGEVSQLSDACDELLKQAGPSVG